MLVANVKSEPQFSKDWDSRLGLVNVIQSRFIGLCDKNFFEKLIVNRKFIILHIICSGWGSSQFEPGVPDTAATYTGVKRIISMGFPVDQLVLSINPLFVNNSGLKRAKEVLDTFRDTGISRVRYKKFRLNESTHAEFLSRFHTIPKSKDIDICEYFRDYGYYRFSEELLGQLDLAILGYGDKFNPDLMPIRELIPDGCRCTGGCVYCEEFSRNSNAVYNGTIQRNY